MFRKSSDKSTVRYLPSTKQQTDKVSSWLVNIVDHLAAKEPDIRSQKNRAKRKVNIGLIFIRRTQTQLQMNANVATCLLDV